MEGTENYVPESTVLSTEQVNQIISGEQAPEEEVILDSEKPQIEALPEKLQGKTQEEIARMYLELEKKLGGREPEPAPQAEPEPAPEPENKTIEDIVGEVLTKHGSADSIPDDVLAELQAKGITKGLIKGLEAGKQAADKQLLNEMTKDYGGADEYAKAIAWAKENWSQVEISEFDQAIAQTEGKPALIKQLINNLMTSYKQVTASQNNAPIHGNKPTQPKVVEGYASKAEMMQDMSNPRYGKDAVWTHAVEARMAKTDRSKWY